MAAYKIDKYVGRHIYDAAVYHNGELDPYRLAISQDYATMIAAINGGWLPSRVFVTNEELVAWRLTS